MGFLGVYRAIYDYVPQGEGELAITEGDLLFVLDNKGNDGWWKARRKAGAEDEEEPEGLVPNNYVEEVRRQLEIRLFDTVSALLTFPRLHQRLTLVHCSNTRGRPTRSCHFMRMLFFESTTPQIPTGYLRASMKSSASSLPTT